MNATDPLGQSQVLPYIIGLASKGYKFSLISFEKEDRFKKNGDLIRKLCETSYAQAPEWRQSYRCRSGAYKGEL